MDSLQARLGDRSADASTCGTTSAIKLADSEVKDDRRHARTKCFIDAAAGSPGCDESAWASVELKAEVEQSVAKP